jgi:plastocyanin
MKTRTLFASLIVACSMLMPHVVDARPRAGCFPAPASICDHLPLHARIPLDVDVLAAGNLFNPTPLDAVLGGSIYFQNFDAQPHTVTADGCLQGGACAFDLELPLGAFGVRARALNLSPHTFVAGQTYHYVCRTHLGMDGWFTVN